jgi:hypothetical protein
MNNTLFGHLVNKFAAHPENLATEALCYILSRSITAKTAFHRQLGKAGVTLDSGVAYQTQATDTDGAIPDLVGKNSSGQQIVIVEAKYWAGLTDNQPETYVKRLPIGEGSILLFIAPAARFPTLWPELVRRSNLTESMTQEVANEFKTIEIQQKHILALVSWRHILDGMISELQSSGEHNIASDVMQLRGLCDQMDTDAFLPLRSEELSSNAGRRIIQFCDLVDNVIESAVQNKIATYEGKISSSKGYYARPFRLGNNGCYLYFDARSWANHRETPVWLDVRVTPAVNSGHQTIHAAFLSR